MLGGYRCAYAWSGAIRAVLSRFLRVMLHRHALQAKNALQADLMRYRGMRDRVGLSRMRVSCVCIVRERMLVRV